MNTATTSYALDARTAYETAVRSLDATDARLNDLLDAPRLLEGRFAGCLLFESARCDEASLRVVGWDGELGLARSERTGYQVAFRVKGEAKPLAKRHMRPELDVELFNIETVAPDGVILGALGESRGAGWRVVA